MSTIQSDPLLIELMRQEEFLRGQLLIVQRVKTYVLEHAKAASLPHDPLKDLDDLLACTETLE